MQFTHLHVHSHYSLLDGLSKIDELLDYVKKLGMDSVAVTDHGVLYGAVEFYKKAKKAGVKPIIGIEAYLARERMQQKRPNIDDKRYHLILLAKNEQGYKNLVKLTTKAHLEGFYYKPRIDEELLAEQAFGLIRLQPIEILLRFRFELFVYVHDHLISNLLKTDCKCNNLFKVTSVLKHNFLSLLHSLLL